MRDEGYEPHEVTRAIIHTRADMVALVSLLNDINIQLRDLRWQAASRNWWLLWLTLGFWLAFIAEPMGFNPKPTLFAIGDFIRRCLNWIGL